MTPSFCHTHRTNTNSHTHHTPHTPPLRTYAAILIETLNQKNLHKKFQEGGEVSALALNNTDDELVTASSITYQLFHWKFNLKELLEAALFKQKPVEEQLREQQQQLQEQREAEAEDDEEGLSLGAKGKKGAKDGEEEKIQPLRTWKVT